MLWWKSWLTTRPPLTLTPPNRKGVLLSLGDGSLGCILSLLWHYPRVRGSLARVKLWVIYLAFAGLGATTVFFFFFFLWCVVAVGGYCLRVFCLAKLHFLVLWLERTGQLLVFTFFFFLSVPIGISRLLASPVPGLEYLMQQENPGNSSPRVQVTGVPS